MRLNDVPALIPGPVVVPGDNRVLYFGRDRAAFRFLSHFYPTPIVLDGESWPTVEHYFQFQKSTDPGYQEAIRSAAHPAHAKQLSASPSAPRRISKRSWFRINDAVPRADWNEIKLDVMRRGDTAKFDQHPFLAEMLISTGDAELIEDSALEPFWGTGPDGLGSNWAGRIIMEVRDRLRSGLRS